MKAEACAPIRLVAPVRGQAPATVKRRKAFSTTGSAKNLTATVNVQRLFSRGRLDGEQSDGAQSQSTLAGQTRDDVRTPAATHVDSEFASWLRTCQLQSDDEESVRAYLLQGRAFLGTSVPEATVALKTLGSRWVIDTDLHRVDEGARERVHRVPSKVPIGWFAAPDESILET